MSGEVKDLTPQAGSGRGLLAASIVLIVLGIVGIVLYATGVPDQFAEGGALGAFRGGVIIGAAACVGVGVLLGALAIVRRTRRAAEGSRS